MITVYFTLHCSSQHKMNIKQHYWTALASTTSSIAWWYEQHLLRKSSRNLQIFSVLQLFFKCFATFRETLIKVLHTEHQKQLKNAANHCSSQKAVTHPRSLTQSIKMKLLCQWISRCQQDESFFFQLCKNSVVKMFSFLIRMTGISLLIL